ncbi:hypothetical protein [Actomonas aquatica]|uniref:DUF4129 domain-containing protein n=1 Tax=Actomonas aquatica TaxID=2866162 RepID=A0ABZ1C3H2_9BACT|nr:hypothetical protein [Opitutus sp. WL0086]WRQ85763.1 hypothetical protein K1X11_013205 [Opitutus sp. WL0086]
MSDPSHESMILQEDLTLLAPPPEASGSGVEFWVGGIVLVMALLAGGLGWYLWRRHSSAPVTAPTGPEPGAVALRELEACETLVREAGPREAIAVLAGTLRRFIAARFGLDAPTLTTEEFWSAQTTRAAVPARHLEFCRRFLTMANQACYAGQQPEVGEFFQVLDQAKVFVQAETAINREAHS